jgi:hypothetical protein
VTGIAIARPTADIRFLSAFIAPRSGNPGIDLSVHNREAPAMKSYRLLLLDSKGRLLGSRAVECMTDSEAIALAERESGVFALIEIWRGGHPVGMFANPTAREHSALKFVPCGPAWSVMAVASAVSAFSCVPVG